MHSKQLTRETEKQFLLIREFAVNHKKATAHSLDVLRALAKFWLYATRRLVRAAAERDGCAGSPLMSTIKLDRETNKFDRGQPLDNDKVVPSIGDSLVKGADGASDEAAALPLGEELQQINFQVCERRHRSPDRCSGNKLGI